MLKFEWISIDYNSGDIALQERLAFPPHAFQPQSFCQKNDLLSVDVQLNRFWPRKSCDVDRIYVSDQPDNALIMFLEHSYFCKISHKVP